MLHTARPAVTCGPSFPLHVTRIVEDPEPLTIRHANPWELLSLLAALQINSEFPAPIFSDCESAVNSLLHITDLGYWRKTDHHFLLSVAYQLLNTTPTSITWIKSHPERRARRCNWTQHEWGIYIADLYASPSLDHPLSFNYTTTDNKTIVVTPTIQLIPLSTLLRSLLPKATYHWADSTTLLPELYHPRTTWPLRTTWLTGTKTTNLV